MLRYVMKDKGFSTTEGFVFMDETDRQLYRADGKNWALSKEYAFKDADGTELIHLKQKLFSLTPTYIISRNNEHYATIKKSGGRFRIDMPSQSPITVDQSFGGMQFAFRRDDRFIANVTRKPISLMENCVVEVETTEDAEMILASMVAIYDMKKH